MEDLAKVIEKIDDRTIDQINELLSCVEIAKAVLKDNDLSEKAKNIEYHADEHNVLLHHDDYCGKKAEGGAFEYYCANIIREKFLHLLDLEAEIVYAGDDIKIRIKSIGESCVSFDLGELVDASMLEEETWSDQDLCLQELATFFTRQAQKIKETIARRAVK